MAKKKPKKGAKKAAARTKPARKRTELPVEQIFSGFRALHGRLNDLERSVHHLRGLSIGGSPFKAEALGAAEADDTVSIGFKKTAGPDGVTVTLTDTGEDVLRPFQDEGKSKPRKKGTTVNAKVVINGGASVNIEVENASPSPLTDRGLRLLTVG